MQFHIFADNFQFYPQPCFPNRIACMCAFESVQSTVDPHLLEPRPRGGRERYEQPLFRYSGNIQILLVGLILIVNS